MAERRMFSKRIINTAKFLKMPSSTQALYFHLGLNADDDGVVEAFPVVRSIGASEDDVRVLISKGYVQVLNDELVMYITDWRENNRIRADRKIDSIYKPLLLQVVPEANLLECKPRADGKRAEPIVGQQVDNQWTSNGQPMDGIGKDSIGKDSIGKVSDNKRFQRPSVEEVQAYCQERGNSVDAQSFIDFYESKGWVVGKSPMKDWKACVRTWERKEQGKTSMFIDLDPGKIY